MPNFLSVLAVSLLVALPSSATPVSMALSDPRTSFVRLTLVASDAFDTVVLLQEEDLPTGGTVDAELLGTLDPGFDISRVSLSSDEVTYTGVAPGVGAVSITLDKFEVHLLGEPLNRDGRLKPSGGFDIWRATASAGTPKGTITAQNWALKKTVGFTEPTVLPKLLFTIKKG